MVESATSLATSWASRLVVVVADAILVVECIIRFVKLEISIVINRGVNFTISLIAAHIGCTFNAEIHDFLIERFHCCLCFRYGIAWIAWRRLVILFIKVPYGFQLVLNKSWCGVWRLGNAYTLRIHVTHGSNCFIRVLDLSCRRGCAGNCAWISTWAWWWWKEE